MVMANVPEMSDTELALVREFLARPENKEVLEHLQGLLSVVDRIDETLARPERPSVELVDELEGVTASIRKDPRWFRYNKNTSVGKPTTDVLFRMERHDEVVQIHLPSGAESPLQVLDDRWLCSPPRPANLADVVCWLENRLWREITAAEAEALLKSKRIVVCKSTACGWSETDPQREAI